MPVMIGKLGAGGLGVNAVNGLRMVVPSVASVSRWLESAGYSFPNQGFLRDFLASHDDYYGFLDYGRFFRDLSNAIYLAPVEYDDIYAGWLTKMYTVVRTAPLQSLLENLRVGIPLPISSDTVTPEDLFALSVVWGAEVALTLKAGHLHVFSEGRPGAVRSPDGHTVLAHTHPTTSQEKTQVARDIEVAGINRAEIVITKNMIIYITRNKIMNVTQGEHLHPLDGMCIDRTTRLNARRFDELHARYLAIAQERSAAEARENEEQRARSRAWASADVDNAWMDFLG